MARVFAGFELPAMAAGALSRARGGSSGGTSTTPPSVQSDTSPPRMASCDKQSYDLSMASQATDLDSEEARETEAQWLRRMLEKEKSEKEWIMARYEVAELSLKAKDEEISKLRSLLENVPPMFRKLGPAAPVALAAPVAPAAPVALAAPKAKARRDSSSSDGTSVEDFGATSDESPAPQASPKGRSLSERRGMTLHLDKPNNKPTPKPAIEPIKPIVAPKPAVEPVKSITKEAQIISRRHSMPVELPQVLHIQPVKANALQEEPQSPKRRASKGGEMWAAGHASAAKAQTCDVLPMLGDIHRVQGSAVFRRLSEPSLSVMPTKTAWLEEQCSPKRVMKKAINPWSSLTEVKESDHE